MTEVYISPTGNDDTGDGTRDLPYLTMTKCRAETSSGDTIIFLSGTYLYSVMGNLGGDRIFRSDTGDFNDVILDIEGENQFVIGVLGANVAPFQLIGVTIQNMLKPSTDNTPMIDVGTGDTEVMGLVQDCRIRNIRGWTQTNARQAIIGSGGQIDGAETYVRFVRCVFENCGKNPSAPNGSLLGRHENGQKKIYEFFNCNFALNVSGTEGLTHLIWAGLNANFPERTMVWAFSNCILTNDQGGAVAIFPSTSSTTVTFEDSCVFAYSGSSFNNIPALGSGTITLDPLYVERQTSDYRLRPNSPALFHKDA